MGTENDNERPRGRNRPRKAVTMEMVGRIAGVSQVTVSRALNDPSKVSPATLRKVNEAITVTGFVPNALAGALASSRSRLVGTLVPSITNIVYASAIQSFTRVMREHGYQIMLSESGYDPEEEEALIATHISRRPDAMLLVGTRHTAASRKMLLAPGIPVVEIWDITDTPVDLCVGFSHIKAGTSVARTFFEAGYRRAGVVSTPDERAVRRKNAFAAEFFRLSGTPVAEAVHDDVASLTAGRECLARLLDEDGFESGIVFCSSDVMAKGAVVEAQSRGIAVPGTIGIVGFGDQDFAAFMYPSLSSVRIDRDALGTIAAEAILRRFNNDPVPDPVVEVGFEIIQREST